MRRILLIMVVMVTGWLWMPSQSSAASFSPVEKMVVDLLYETRAVQAVYVDMERVAVYQRGSPGFREDETQKAIAALKEIRRRVVLIVPPEPLAALRTGLFGTIDLLTSYCQAYLNQDEAVTARAEDRFVDQSHDLADQWREAIAAVVMIPHLTDDFDPQEEEARFLADEKSRERFRRAEYFLEEKKFADAAAELAVLRDAHRGTPAEGSIVLRMIRAKEDGDNGSAPVNVEGDQLKTLLSLIDSGVYYPNAYEIFIYWRSLYQEFNYTVAEDAAIPNTFYLEKSRTLVSAVERYLKDHPDDEWARTQLFLLAQLPVLERNGSSTAVSGDEFSGKLFGLE